jgi:hypothetical protein
MICKVKSITDNSYNFNKLNLTEKVIIHIEKKPNDSFITFNRRNIFSGYASWKLEQEIVDQINQQIK